MIENWHCEECNRVEKNDPVRVKRIPRFLLLLWSWLRKILNLVNLDIPEAQECFKGEEKEIKVEVSVRCHHCGKPLCQKHRILILDNAFSFDEEKIREHLPSWWPESTSLKASKRFRNLESQIMSLLANYHPRYRKLRQKAYHCKKCWQEYHLTAVPEPDKEKV